MRGEAEMVSYRLYRIDAADRFTSAEWVDATTDGQVLAILPSYRRGAAKCELWHNSRLVARLADQDLEAVGG